MTKTINTVGAALNLNPQAIACVSGCIGKTLAMDILRDIALQGVEALDKFAKVDCAAVFAADNGFKPGTGLATMDKAQPSPRGLKTFYNYFLGLRKFAVKGDTQAILTAKAGELMGGADKAAKAAKAEAAKAAKAAKERAEAEALKAAMGQPRPLTVTDCLIFLYQAKATGMLTAADLESIEGLLPQRRTVDMGMVIDATPALPQPAATH